MSVVGSKNELRRTLSLRVREIGAKARRLASQHIVDSIFQLAEWSSAKAIVSYAPLMSEPDLWPVFDVACNEGKKVLFTAIEDNEIVLYEITDREQLLKGDFGIMEPDPKRCRRLSDLSEIDLLLIPGVGFDLGSMSRMGRGKGHYDRFLEKLREANSHAQVLGVCFAVQLDDVPLESHDQPMDRIVTEAGCDEIEWILGFGSNLGDRGQKIREACELLNAETCSSLYETAPVGCAPGTPEFLNAVAMVRNAIGPCQMLRLTQGLEEVLGRPSNHGFHTPRTIDIDLLFAGEASFGLPNLSIPHVSWQDRGFVSDPLLELIRGKKITARSVFGNLS